MTGDNFFKTNVLVYKLSGIFLHGPTDSSLFRKCLKWFWSIAVFGPSTAYVMLELWILRETIHEIKRFLNQTALFLTHLLGIAKVILLVVRHRRLMILEKRLQTRDFFYEDCGSFRPGKILNDARRLSSAVSMTLYCLYSLVGGSALIATELTIQRNIKGDIIPSNVTCYDFMQYYFYIPWRTETKTSCRLTNLFMSYCLACCAFFIACHDGYFAALSSCLKAQLNVLCGAITTVRLRIVKRLKLPSDLTCLHDENYWQLEDELYKEMRKFNKHMTLLLRAADEVEDIFTIMILAQTTSSIIIMASILFYATNIPITSPVFFSQAEYFVCIFIQLSVFCWFGSEVTHASDRINDCLYNSNWYSGSKRYKSSMLTMMTRMQRPIRLTIGRFFPLTLTAIVKVTKASVSYYAVFKSVGIDSPT